MENMAVGRAVFLIIARSLLGLSFMFFVATAADLPWYV
jgi:hypothetical protein